MGWRPLLYRGNQASAPEQERFLLKLTIHKKAGVEPDVWAETGEATSASTGRTHMEVAIHVVFDPAASPRCFNEVASALHQTSRHEIEHLLDEGVLALSGPACRTNRRTPMQEGWQKSVRLIHWYRIRARLFARGSVTLKDWAKEERRLDAAASHPQCGVCDYMVSAKEMHAFVKGFQAEAKFRGVPWDVPMHEYVDSMVTSGKATHDEARTIKSMMTRWAVHVIPRAPITPNTLERYL